MKNYIKLTRTNIILLHSYLDQAETRDFVRKDNIAKGNDWTKDYELYSWLLMGIRQQIALINNLDKTELIPYFSFIENHAKREELQNTLANCIQTTDTAFREIYKGRIDKLLNDEILKEYLYKGANNE